MRCLIGEDLGILEFHDFSFVIFEFCPEFSNLFLGLLHFRSHLTVKHTLVNLVYIHGSLYMLSLLAKMKCINGLLIVREGLCHRTNDGCFRISTESCLKDTSELRVTEVNESLAASG